MTGSASVNGATLKIFVAKINASGNWTEYVYTNSSYPNGAKGLSIAAEGNAVYVAGALRAQTTKPFKTTVIKIDSSLTAPVWVNINKNSEWPLAIGLSTTNVIYTVDFALKVVGFSKSTGSQLFAKNDFKNYAQVYNQPISSAILSNNQLMFQASVGVKVSGQNTVNKVTAKYSTAGAKVYQQLESLSLVSPGNPGSAEALGLAYSTAGNYSVEVFRKYSSAGDLFYVNGRNAPTALRVAPEAPEENYQLSVFPNPAHENFTIKSGQKIVRWVLYDAIMHEVSANKAGEYEVEVNCALLKGGIYFLRITTEDGEIASEKIIIR
jgi:hypothetical protein